MTNELGTEAYTTTRGRGRWGMMLAALGAGVALAVAAGCGSSDADPYPTVQSFCQSKATAECTVATADCSVTMADCLQAREATCNADATTAQSEGRVYTSSLVQACIVAVNNAYSDNDGNLSASDISTFTDTCERVYQGTKKVNQACTDDYDCTGTMICDPIFKACGVDTPTNAGAPCNNPGDVCVEHFYCGTTTGTVSGLHECVARKAIGGTCSDTVLCDQGSFCSSGTCMAALATGEVCSADDQCQTGSICDPYAGANGQSKCDQGIRFAPLSPSCNPYSVATAGLGGDTVPPTSDAGSTAPDAGDGG